MIILIIISCPFPLDQLHLCEYLLPNYTEHPVKYASMCLSVHHRLIRTIINHNEMWSHMIAYLLHDKRIHYTVSRLLLLLLW